MTKENPPFDTEPCRSSGFAAMRASLQRVACRTTAEAWTRTFGDVDLTLADRPVPKVEVAAWLMAPGVYSGGGDPRRHTIWVHPTACSFRVRKPINNAGRAIHHFGPGAITLQRAGEHGSVSANQGAALLTISISAEAFEEFAEQAGGNAKRLRRSFGDVDMNLLGTAWSLLGKRSAGMDSLHRDAITDRLFTCLAEQYLGRPPRPVGRLATRLVERVDEYVHEHLDTHITIESMAELAGLSTYHFARAFAAATGQTPHRYVMQARVEQAAGLLAGSRQPLSEIAYATGFADQSHLTRWSKRIYGVTPATIRASGIKTIQAVH